MTEREKCRLVAALQGKNALAGAGVIVIEGPSPQVLRRPSATGSKLYVILCGFDTIFGGHSQLNSVLNLQLRLSKVRVQLTEISLSGVIGGYACIVGSLAPGFDAQSCAQMMQATKAMQSVALSISSGGRNTGAGAGSAFSAVQQQAAGGSEQAQLMLATKEMQEMNMSFNLQYLGLQQKMQGDNRQFTLMSNIMKIKHDTAKSAINNVR